MKPEWKRILNIVLSVLMAASVALMAFTIISVATFDQKDRNLFGYRLFVVTSDSMRATDFAAGDLIVVRQVDKQSLQIGDIISFTSTRAETYGQIITHKIREILIDESGKYGFVTYGTTTGVTDDGIVLEDYLLGKYQMRIPRVGEFFCFLKTTPGYIFFVLIPFSAMIAYYGISSVRQFQKYRESRLPQAKDETEGSKEGKQSVSDQSAENQRGE